MEEERVVARGRPRMFESSEELMVRVKGEPEVKRNLPSKVR